METIPVYGFDFNVVFEYFYDRIFFGGDVATTGSMLLFWWGVTATLISAVLVVIIANLLLKMANLKHASKLEFAAQMQPLPLVQAKNDQWERVKTLSESVNPSDWKLAVIEADAMLDELIKNMGYPGENLGERLKAIESSDFEALDDAWEAHKVRNQIAHQAGFVLTEREVKVTLARYERVFKEYNQI